MAAWCVLPGGGDLARSMIYLNQIYKERKGVGLPLYDFYQRH